MINRKANRGAAWRFNAVIDDVVTYEAHKIFSSRGVHCTSAKIGLDIGRTTTGRPYNGFIVSCRGDSRIARPYTQ